MLSNLLKSLLGKPKTYIPLLVILITWGLGQAGFEITPELKESIYTLCAAAAAWLIRRGMVKEKEMNHIIEERVEERVGKRIDILLDNIAEAKGIKPEKRTPGKAK